MSRIASPFCLRRRAPCCWCGVSFGLRPSFTPRGGRAMSWCRPCIAQGSETGFPLGDRRKRVQQISGGSGQAVEPRHHQHVARLKCLDHAAKLRPIGLRSLTCTSRNTLRHPALVSCRAWASTLSLLPPGDTRAQPYFMGSLCS